MKTIQDQLGRKLDLEHDPKRIISLVPSQTEFLVDYGIGDRLVGVTKFCVHPKNLRSKYTIVGGTKQVKMDVIKELRPDLIIANKEENLKEDIEELFGVSTVWVSDIKTEIDAIEMMNSLAEILNLDYSDQTLRNQLHQLSVRRKDLGRAMYLIWRNPYMAAGGDTFINRMLELSGFTNVLKSLNRYPEVLPEEYLDKEVDHIFLSSEPFPFKEKHIKELAVHFPNADIRLVDGECFSWYGSRMNYAVEYILREFY